MLYEIVCTCCPFEDRVEGTLDDVFEIVEGHEHPVEFEKLQ